MRDAGSRAAFQRAKAVLSSSGGLNVSEGAW